MVALSRVRSAVLTLAAYAVLGAASAYLVWGASQGEHGLKAMAGYKTELSGLNAQLADLRREREVWRIRVRDMSPSSVSRDLLDGEAHAMLDRVDKGEVAVLLTPEQRAGR